MNSTKEIKRRPDPDLISLKPKIQTKMEHVTFDDSKKKEPLKKVGSTEKQDVGNKEANKKIASPQSENKK